MLYYAQQYATTKLNVSGGIDASQTTGIVLLSVTGIDITKPGILCFGWSDPLVSGEYEYITYTSIDGSNELQGVTRGVNSTGITHANQVDVAWVLSEDINNLNDMFTTGGDGYTQISTPSNPASGYNKLYFKSDDKLYKLNSAGTEAEVGSAGFKAILTPLSATFPASNYPQLVKNAGTNQLDFTLDYDASTDETATWQLVLPAGLTINSATLYITFRMASATSGAVVWGAISKSLAEGEAWDTAGNTDTFDAETVQDTAGKICQTSKALTITGWAAGENLQIKIFRDADNGSDTATGDAKLMSVNLVIS